MAQFNYFNFATAANNAAGIEAARIRNQLAGIELEEADAAADKRKRFDQIVADTENMPARINALRSEGFFKEADQLQQSHGQILKGAYDVAKVMRQTMTPDNWKAARQELITSGMPGDQIPTEYDEAWLKGKEDEAKRNWEKLSFTYTDPNTGREMTQDVRADDRGTFEPMGLPYNRQSGGGSGGGGGRGTAGGLKASDSNAIANGVATLFGGVWDERTQQLMITDKDKLQEALDVTGRAEEHFRNDPQIGHREAVRRAAAEYGFKFRGETGGAMTIQDLMRGQQQRRQTPPGWRGPGIPVRPEAPSTPDDPFGWNQ